MGMQPHRRRPAAIRIAAPLHGGVAIAPRTGIVHRASRRHPDFGQADASQCRCPWRRGAALAAGIRAPRQERPLPACMAGSRRERLRPIAPGLRPVAAAIAAGCASPRQASGFPFVSLRKAPGAFPAQPRGTTLAFPFEECPWPSPTTRLKNASARSRKRSNRTKRTRASAKRARPRSRWRRLQASPLPATRRNNPGASPPDGRGRCASQGRQRMRNDRRACCPRGPWFFTATTFRAAARVQALAASALRPQPSPKSAPSSWRTSHSMSHSSPWTSRKRLVNSIAACLDGASTSA